MQNDVSKEKKVVNCKGRRRIMRHAPCQRTTIILVESSGYLANKVFQALKNPSHYTTALMSTRPLGRVERLPNAPESRQTFPE
jgi:hypothetical protein